MSFVVVVILTEERSNTNASLPAVLDSALQEVMGFYNYDKKRVFVNIETRTTRVTSDETSTDVTNPHFTSTENALVENARGQFWGVYDQWKLIGIVRDQFGNQYKDDILIIITDLEITPPSGWRYVLWNLRENDAVISLAAMNPEYWGLRDRYLLTTIKRRVRASCLHVVGKFLGLRRCDNPICFLNRDVDSVTTLDGMVSLGKEHKLEELTNLRFSEKTSDPSKVQPIEVYSGPFGKDEI